MAKKTAATVAAPQPDGYDSFVPHGPKIAAFLKSQGFVETKTTIKFADAARHLSSKGHRVIRQRLVKITTSKHVRDSTLEGLADAFGVTVERMLGVQKKTGSS